MVGDDDEPRKKRELSKEHSEEERKTECQWLLTGEHTQMLVP